MQFEPELAEITFGQEIYDYDNKFPYQAELRRLSVSRGQLKLSAVVYKCWKETGAINAIGLEFADGNREVKAKEEEIRKIVVDPTKDISQISMVINPYQQLHGLTLKCKKDKKQSEIQQF